MIELSIFLTSAGAVRLSGYEQLLRFGYTKNRGVYCLAVTATGEWEGLTIRAFWHTPGGDPQSSLVVDGSVDVPASVTAQPGNGCITFEGSDGTKTVTSTDLRYRVDANSGTEDGTEPEPGTPAWQAFVEAVKSDATAAEQAKTDAQTAASEAATSAGNADQSAQKAAGSLQELKDTIASGNFKGEKGDKGDTGPQGPKGDTGPAVALDTTLTHEGEAADAKATGDKISKLKEDTAALQDRQNILVGTETGNPIAVDDAFSAPLCGLTVYGKSTQDGTPSPDNPVPIVSAGDGGTIKVIVTGANLLDLSKIIDIVKGNSQSTVKDGHVTGKTLSKYAQIGFILKDKLNTQYTFSYSGGAAGVSTELRVYIWDNNSLSDYVAGKTVPAGEKASCTFKTDGKHEYAVWFRPNGISDYDFYDIQLELGSTATAYSPTVKSSLRCQLPLVSPASLLPLAATTLTRRASSGCATR